MKRSVILLFGSFNPVHKGHIAVADNALEELQADELWFVVSPENPFKHASTLAPEADRLAMVEIAIRSARHKAKMKTSDVEFSMPRPSRTIDTLNTLSKRFPGHKFTLLIGADNVANFGQWKNAEEIVEKYTVAVYPRDGYDPHSSEYSDRFVYLKNAPLEPEAATPLRHQMAAGGKGFTDLPAGVEKYIRKHGLYGSTRTIDDEIEEINELMDTAAHLAENFLHRGKLYYRKGCFDLALNDFLEVIELDRANEEAREYRDLLREIFAFRHTDIYNP